MSGREAIPAPLLPFPPRQAARTLAILALAHARSRGLIAVNWRHEKIGRWFLGFHVVRSGQKPRARELITARRCANRCLEAPHPELWACRTGDPARELTRSLDKLLDAVEALVEAGFVEIQGSPESRALWSELAAHIATWREGRHV